MRIAQVAPLYESVPPAQYGGTERVVHWLTEELIARGHEVTLYASGDSATAGRLRAGCAASLRTNGNGVTDTLALHVAMLERVVAEAKEFDVVHFHVDYLHFPFSRRIRRPHVTTLHGRLDLPELPLIYDTYPEMPVVSISDHQRTPLPQAHWQSTVYHGFPADWMDFHPRGEGYLAFLGRICPEKRVDRAIEIAKRSGKPLKIAAKIDPVDEEYFEREIRHLLDHPLIEFVGEIDDERKDAFLGRAEALLFPIDWPEPFGLVLIESLAAGTPIIGWRCGSVPELLEHGVCGFIVEGIDAAVEAVGRIGAIERTDCRLAFERRFTVERMVDQYEKVYASLID